MTDSKYFTNNKKGEIFELKNELNSDKKERKKEAVKKVIASMTVGKDVSALFPDVINCMQTDNLELKKLVYLYLMNYAKSQPDMAIMAVNTFVKDCDDSNPLIRALAVRTMGCIRVDKITEYMCEPLRKCLKDEDPYVRKTAAVSVAKLYDINAQLVEDQGFLDSLKDLLSDSNPMVVANAVAALSEIMETSSTASQVVDVNTQIINKLLTALNECTEWGQVFILDAVSNYDPKDEREAQSICERITPRLAHANSAIVLSSVKVIMKLIEMMDPNSEVVSMLVKKLAPPMVTLLSAEQETQYVALRNINLIVQKRPDILKTEMKVFFVKYNDPIYVKLEKLDIMIRLTNQSNIAQVLAELKEYATEVDVDFVRKSVRAIGRCAIKVEQAAERCVSTLLDLIQTKVNYVVQEAIVVIKDIFRKYPNKYESIISTLCENLDTLDEPEAKASMVWIIGEYAERIDNADELLEGFLEGFQDENTQVQLQLLTAIVKLFLKRPTDTQELVQQVLSLATQDSDNPDLRDRGYIYWRLLSTDPAAAKDVVLAEKPLISEETDLIEPTLLDELICHISSLASVYHKPPNAFVEGRAGSLVRRVLPKSHVASSDANQETVAQSPAAATQSQPPVSVVIPGVVDSLIGDLLDMDINPPMYHQQGYNMQQSNTPIPPSNDMDLLGEGLDSLLGGVQGSGLDGSGSEALGGLRDIFGLAQSASYIPPQEVWLTAAKGKGLEVSGTFSRKGGQMFMELTLTNKALQPLMGFATQFNKNSFAISPAQPLNVTSLMPNQSLNVSILLSAVGQVQKMEPLNNLQVAIKNNISVFYFSCLIPVHVLFVEDGEMEKRTFLATWKDIPVQNEVQYEIKNVQHNADTVSQKLRNNNVFTVAKRNVEGQDMLYQSIKLTNGIWVLTELKIQPGNQNFMLSLKSRAADVYPVIQQSYETILHA
ncbi:hypothetical protein HELRODRAFT_193557 [Helobdella robusta]|uniref:AP complex subunit beta n=1 Tax=Helobdella robusta TaxID=6412 RepID=T1FV47_HELRO|nr:hypothetical protein HELRODRAFT_193557 [Helobdella robusta]ESN95331.1 hypothetical protein HELRODRAFT_193557 [Helobdella robusta]